MGIFDAFTGKPATDAAAANSAALAAAKKESLKHLTVGRTGALDALGVAGGMYGEMGAKYGAGTDLYLDSLGVNGAAGNARAGSAFTAAPGYDWKVNQSLDALDRRASSRGMLNSGNTTLDTLTTVHGIADQTYGDWQTRLAGLINPEMAGVSGAAGVEAAKAPVWTNDASARAGIATNTANAIAGQTTQAANAQMAANGNMWNFGLNAAKAVAGAATGMPMGGTSMLGGGGPTGVGLHNPGGYSPAFPMPYGGG